MLPLCCVSAITDNSSPIKPSPSAGTLAGLSMPPFPSAVRSDSFPRPAGHGHVSHSVTNGGDCSRASQQQQQLPSTSTSAAVDVRINDLVGNGISGILHKWVNYGKGWRPRWFVLQDGVLSYYKIHGPDKIVVNPETEKGSKVIGDESMRIISRNRKSHRSLQRKPFGEIHLKVHPPFPFDFALPLIFHWISFHFGFYFHLCDCCCCLLEENFSHETRNSESPNCGFNT